MAWRRKRERVAEPITLMLVDPGREGANNVLVGAVLGKWQDSKEEVAVCQGLYQPHDFLVPKMAGTLWRESLSLENVGTGPR